MNKQERYYVDKRVGCIAVRDRNKIIGSNEGLHHDDVDVVKYWQGKREEKICFNCGNTKMSEWVVPDECIVEAHNLCNELNTRKDKE